MLITTLEEMERERKSRSFKIDEAVIRGLQIIAKRENSSVNRIVENALMDYTKREGVLDQNLEPLGETRGLSPKETSTAAETLDNDN